MPRWCWGWHSGPACKSSLRRAWSSHCASTLTLTRGAVCSDPSATNRPHRPDLQLTTRDPRRAPFPDFRRQLATSPTPPVLEDKGWPRPQAVTRTQADRTLTRVILRVRRRWEVHRRECPRQRSGCTSAQESGNLLGVVKLRPALDWANLTPAVSNSSPWYSSAAAAAVSRGPSSP
jgi:hypothetical protein